MNLSINKILVILLIGSVGTGSALYFGGVIQKPDYGLEDRGDWGEVEDNNVEIISTGYVHNPNSFGINLSQLNIGYNLKMNDVLLAEGGKSGIQIPAGNNTTIDVSTHLHADKVPEWWARHLENGESSRLEVPVNLEYNALSRNISFDGISYTDTIDTDIESKLDQSFSNIEGDYRWSLTGTDIEQTEITISDVSAQWGDVSSDTTNLLIEMSISNPNTYPIPMPQLTGGLTMNNIRVADWDANNVEITNAAQDAVIQPGETQEVVVKTSMDNDKIDEWFISHVAGNEQTEAETEIKMLFEVAGQELALPQSGMKCGFNFRTAILVDNQKSSGGFEGCNQNSMISPDRDTEESSDSDNTTTDIIGGLL